MAGARLARDESSAEARRSMVSTMPGDPAESTRAWLSDRPGWCVDLGATLRAMSTCDLWLALAKGDIAPETRVWREGMAYWEPIARVPEFALALPDVSVWSSRPGAVAAARTAGAPASTPFEDEIAAIAAREIAAGAAVPRAGAQMGARTQASTGTFPGAHAHAGAHAITGAHAGMGAHPGRTARAAHEPELERGTDPFAVRVVTLAPPSDFSTPAPVVVEELSPPPESHARPRWLPRFDRRSAASVVAGAVVAIAALALATTGPAHEEPPASAGARPAAAPALSELRIGAPAPEQASSAEDPRTAALRDGPDGAPTADPGQASTAPGTARSNTSVHKPGVAPATGTFHTSAGAAGHGIGGRAPSVQPARLRVPRGPHATDRGQRRARSGAR